MWRKKSVLSILVLSVLLLQNSNASTIRQSFVENIHSGIKMAGKFLGIDTASDVANLVARAFSPTAHAPNRRNGILVASQSPPTEGQIPGENQIINSMLHLMGLEPGKVGAMALNGVIFLAQMIGTGFDVSKDKPTGSSTPNQQPNDNDLPPGTPLDWILNNPSTKFKQLMQDVRDAQLTPRLIEMVEDFEYTTGDADCLKLLICKMNPFIGGMQQALNERLDPTAETRSSPDKEENLTRMKILFKYLPNMTEFSENGQLCEEKFNNCKLYQHDEEKAQPKSEL